ncbi:MAG: methanogenesis marker 6 protein [Candidatus Methanomethylicota archaeon]|jgi:putative methanogenesis marker protein 6|uniref:Methanogenesis marker 6 protein n=1 Tax=Thermoproteota archaeon TaxID=2056631 RepID=A0A520KIF4_9CREN|nr:methanogenesis marker 6 protein [Candidatus Methanomethylicia archaeon]RZN57880.1 MAG: methanogenesis marker 6 protein [Candidatus Verstraetearchaeota archaeon]TDA37988.1 MAG: methanogenesis marker 6 protein [Candidatus Verstraetearchaeota archaeon]
MKKTYVVMLSPDSSLTPSMLIEKISLISGINYKETCYGLLIEGEEEDLKKAIKELESMDPNRIFFKIRGYRIGDERICRAKRGGGPRPGFFMLGTEREALKNVAKALEEERPVEEKPKKKGIDIEVLKKIIEEEIKH